MSSITTNLSFTNKSLVILCFIITIISCSYFVINNKNSGVSIISSIVSSVSQIHPSQCHLSLIESDGWFCEFNTDWKRRKQLHHIQDKRNRISDRRFVFFQNNWEPTIQCEFERRLGNTGDGGKWVCDIHRFEQMNGANLLIYSFGSNGDFSFERAMKEQLSKAEIHTFDMGLYRCPENICVFHQVRLGNGKTNQTKSLPMIINELGHQKRQIHILKVDIEGSEYDLFEDLFKNRTNVPYIRQILFEIHLGNDKNEESSRRTHRLFELFRSNYYAIYHKEPNLYDPQNVCEFGLLRLNEAFFNSSI